MKWDPSNAAAVMTLVAARIRSMGQVVDPLRSLMPQTMGTPGLHTIVDVDRLPK